MLSISHRGQKMPPSPIRKLVPFAEAAKKGTKVYHLNIGQPDIATPEPILDAERTSDFKVLEYSHSAGNESYRKKLVEYYAKVGICVTAEQSLLQQEEAGNTFGLMACMDVGDELLYLNHFMPITMVLL
jgi:aspartate aminotransferase